jgi:ankyrin repeat protein
MTFKGNAEELLKALMNNECTRVGELITNDADVNLVDAKGTRPLQYAAQTGCVLHRAAGQLLAVKCLIKKGARATAADNRGRLPLHQACFGGHVDVARFLLEKHPDTVNCTTSEEDGR